MYHHMVCSICGFLCLLQGKLQEMKSPSLASPLLLRRFAAMVCHVSDIFVCNKDFMLSVADEDDPSPPIVLLTH